LKNNILYSAALASYGLYATLVADLNTTEYRKPGDKRFGLVAKDLLFPGSNNPPHKYLAKVSLHKAGHPEVMHREEHGYVLATLVSDLEKTFTISPNSKPFGGDLRVFHFGALGGEDMIGIIKAAYNNEQHVQLNE
jgi:hypothetical protein